MAQQPLISVIIPVYGHQADLGQSLLSLAAQSYERLEIMVVDDGNETALSFPRSIGHVPITYIRQAHAGAAVARNRGAKAASGEYLLFWDADVIGEPEMIETLYEALQKNPVASYAYSDYRLGYKKMPAKTFDGAALRINNYISMMSLVRRSAFTSFDESLQRFQDWDLWLTLLDAGKTGTYVPAYLFHVKTKRGNISQWLPSFVYHSPWKRLPGIRQKVERYEAAKRIVTTKHGIRP